MSKLSKRAISILVIATFMMSIFAAMPVKAAVIAIDVGFPVAGTSYVFDKTIVVKGTGVTSGAVVNLYWDYVNPEGLMNSTQGEPDGTFEVSLDVPEATFGDHYLWVKDVGSNLVDTRMVNVDSLVTLKPSSGLPDDEVDVSGYGFDAAIEITMTFVESSTSVIGEVVGTGNGITVIWPLFGSLVLPGEVIKVNDVVQTKGIDYSFDYTSGTINFLIGSIPTGLSATTPVFTGTGDGTMSAVTVSDTDTVTETWTVTCTDETPGSEMWSVTGSVSLLQTATATIGAPYISDANEVAFTITAGAIAFIVTDEFTFDTTIDEDITADYSYGASASYDMTPSTPPETSDVGSFTSSFTVPEVFYGDYFLRVIDEVPHEFNAPFTVGASITLDVEEGPEGTVIEVYGVGFNTPTLTGIFWDEIATPMTIVGEPTEPIQVSGGTFTAEVVAPSDGEGDHIIIVEDTIEVVDVTAKFTVDGVATVEVDPTYGAPGSTITVTGSNFTQIADTEVTLNLYHIDHADCPLSPVKTKSDGTFETTFRSPAATFATYKLQAIDGVYGTSAYDTFKVGMIAFIINPLYGEAGSKISITGIGFEPGDYNLTFGDKVYADFGVVVGEAISDDFYVPSVEPGVYDLVVIDSVENELTVSFTVTDSTVISIDPAVAPNDYNVILKGYHFTEDEAADLEFILYNSTESWDITADVYEYNSELTDPYSIFISAELDEGGNLTAFWKVSPDTVLSLGDYILNVTAGTTFFQAPFSVVVARVSVEPRKALFDRGDMIQFDIKNDFKLINAYIEIYDPSDILYWSTPVFEDPFWMQIEGLYTVPYYRQTDVILNPMELQSDAPMGTWLYIFYEEADTELMNGTFMVGVSSAAQVEQRLTEIWSSMEDLSTDIDSITDELAGDISDLSGDIDDVVADVQDMVDDITADLAEELAGVAEDTEAAVGELEDAIGDIASAQNELASDLEDSLQTSIDAKEAAEAAQDSAQGLTTLVYGAIAASLIAALAAVVSLMQISKKIA